MTIDTRTALMDHAEYFARAQGFDGFSYADLAEAVSIRKASIHYHFPTKAGLSAALMARYTETFSQRLEEIAVKSATASGRISALIALYRGALNDGNTLCLCVSLSTCHQSLSDEVNAQIAQFRVMMVAWLKNVFALGLQDNSISRIASPEPEARACLALLEGAQLAARAEVDVAVFDQAVVTLKSRLQ